jgi:hypothetical protein
VRKGREFEEDFLMLLTAVPALENELRNCLPLYRFTVEQYRRMVETGILAETERVELLEGYVVARMVHNPPHDAAVDYAQEILRALLPRGWRVREQKAILAGRSQPEPDLAIVRGPASRYARRHPGPKDIALLIEVSDASLAYDRGPKLALYGRSRIPIYWIVNLVDSQVEVYTKPRAGRSPTYQEQCFYGLKDAVPLVIEGQEACRIPVQELLP